MLNKYTLQFLFKDQAEQYESYSQSQKFIDVSMFSIYALVFIITYKVFCILNVVKLIIINSFLYSLIAGITILILLILWRIQYKKPQYINFIVTIYQAVVLLSYKMPVLLSNEPNPLADQAWFYGFQCCFLHFSIYLLSANFIYQTFLLLIVICLHLIKSDIILSEGIINTILFISLTFSMISIKYNYEKTKKEQYVQSCQQEKWEQILSKVLTSSILLISHDKKQDQLLLEKENKFSSILFKLKDSENLRQLLRQLVVTSSGDPDDSISNLVHINMESILRKFLIYTQEYSDTFKTYKYMVQHQKTQKCYNVKLLRCVFNNKLQCLIIIDSKKKMLQNQTQVMWSIIQSIADIANDQSRFLVKIMSKIYQFSNKSKQIDYQMQYYLNHNFLQNIQQVFSKKLKNIKLQQITATSLQTILEPLIEFDQIKFHLNKPFQHDLIIIQQLLTSCLSISQNIYKDMQIKSIIIEDRDYEISFLIKIFKSEKPIQFKLLDILQSNWIKSSKGFFQKSSFHQQFLERMGYLLQQFQVPINLLLNISITQLILSEYGTYNHLEIQDTTSKETTLKFCLLHQSQQ